MLDDSMTIFIIKPYTRYYVLSMAWHSGPISHIRERAEGDHQAVLCHCPIREGDLEVLGCEPLGETLIVGVHL